MKIGRNVTWNLLGFLLPALVLFLSYPPFLRALGAERFGVLVLAMSLAAALSFLDLGLSAASLRFVVNDIHHDRFDDAARVMVTTLSFFGALGIFISAAMFVLSPWLVGMLKVVPMQAAGALIVFRLTALQISFSLLLGTMAGLFKALDRFDLSTLTVTALAIVMNAFPATLVSVFRIELPAAIGATVIAMAALVVVIWRVLRAVAVRRSVQLRDARPDMQTFRRIFSFGATLTVHLVIGMLFTQGQRVLIGFMFGPSALSGYQLALTLVSKIHAGISAAAEIALPIASRSESGLLRRNYVKANVALGFFALVPLAILALAGQFVISKWLGPSAPSETARLLPPLCLAYFFVALSALPYYILNGMGRPLVNVWFSLFNISVFLVLLLTQYLLGHATMMNVALAYAVSNVACGLLYQVYCYRLLVRSVTLPQARMETA